MPPPPASEVPQLVRSGKRWVKREEMLQRAGDEDYITVWRWMRQGKFPLPYIVGGQNMWLESELDEWQANLPRREYRKTEVA